MKTIIFMLLCIPAVCAGVGVWKEYPISLPASYTNVRALSVNDAGIGYAFVTGNVYPGSQATFKLEKGSWRLVTTTPFTLANPSISRDGTIYSTDDRASGNVYRFDGMNWKVVGLPGRFGISVFEDVAAVGPREFWAFGTYKSDGTVVAVYFQGDEPRKVFRLGPLVTPNHLSGGEIAVPRAAGVNSDCYLVVHASNNPYSPHRWVLFVLRTDGDYTPYPFPLDNYNCDGICAYQPGNVKIMLTSLSLTESRLYTFSGGIFRETAVFPERVLLGSYPTPNDGWGWSLNNRIYHWSGGGINSFYDIPGYVREVEMISVAEGWAGGHVDLNGTPRPKLWYYSDVEPSLTPTSLGRVKAAFK